MVIIHVIRRVEQKSLNKNPYLIENIYLKIPNESSFSTACFNMVLLVFLKALLFQCQSMSFSWWSCSGRVGVCWMTWMYMLLILFMVYFVVYLLYNNRSMYSNIPALRQVDLWKLKINLLHSRNQFCLNSHLQTVTFHD